MKSNLTNGKIYLILILLLSINCKKQVVAHAEDQINTPPLVNTQKFTEILGRPTNSSVTMSILFDQPSDVYWEYGTASFLISSATEVCFRTKSGNHQRLIYSP